MSHENEKFTRVTVCMPNVVADAVEKAANADYTSVSYVYRRAVVDDLRKRGLLPAEETA
jgi:hypothetical protein